MKSNSEYTGYPEHEAIQYDRKRFQSPSGIAFDSMEKSELERFLCGVDSDTQLIEVGCGTGRFLRHGQDLGYKILGADLSEAMILQAQRNTQENTSFCIADGCNLPFDDCSFGGVYSIRTVNQLPSRRHALSLVKEMVRICEPGGKLLVEFVNGEGLFNKRHEECTYIKYSDICDIFEENGVRTDWKSGILFFSQTVLENMPNQIVPKFAKLDAALGKSFPGQSTRCYIAGTKIPGN